MAASETYSKFFLRDYHAECHTILLEQRKNQSMLNLNSIFIVSDNPKGLVVFYEKAFGKPSEMPDSEML